MVESSSAYTLGLGTSVLFLFASVIAVGIAEFFVQQNQGKHGSHQRQADSDWSLRRLVYSMVFFAFSVAAGSYWTWEVVWKSGFHRSSLV